MKLVMSRFSPIGQCLPITPQLGASGRQLSMDARRPISLARGVTDPSDRPTKLPNRKIPRPALSPNHRRRAINATRHSPCERGCSGAQTTLHLRALQLTLQPGVLCCEVRRARALGLRCGVPAQEARPRLGEPRHPAAQHLRRYSAEGARRVSCTPSSSAPRRTDRPLVATRSTAWRLKESGQCRRFVPAIGHSSPGSKTILWVSTQAGQDHR